MRLRSIRSVGVWATLSACLSCAAGGCGRAPAPEAEASAPAFDASGAVVSGCVESYDPGRDYFPVKAEPVDAELFRLSYQGSYKLLDIDAAGAPGGTARYLLVQCGTPVPEGFDDRTVVSVPARRLAVTHSYLQEALVLLDAVDRLVGVQRVEYAAAPAIRAGLESGAILPVGAGHHTDIELISALDPDAVLVYEPFLAESGMLTELGVAVIPSSDGREPTMMGATEWMSVVGALLNREADMARVLEETRERYRALADRVRDVERRPRFIVGRPYRGSWYLPGGRNNWARLIEDAGGRYVLADDSSSSSLPRALEGVIDRGDEVEVWIGVSDASSMAELLADEPRLSSLQAVRDARVWGSDGARGADGYNPYWEHRLPYPDRMLADLIRILHPDRLPGHELRYFRPLPEESG